MIYMGYAVVQLSQFTTVPTVGGTYEVTCDALQFIDIGRTALRTSLQMVVGILVTTVHATVAVVVHTTVAHVQLIHHVNHTHDDLWVVGGIAVNLYVEDMSATGYLVIRSLYLCLVTGRALVVHRYVVGVGVIITVGDAWDATELQTVFLGEFSAEAFCRCGEYGVIMVIPLTEIVYTLTHVFDNLQTQFLTLLTFPMVLAG
jgi:hypothetical protein